MIRDLLEKPIGLISLLLTIVVVITLFMAFVMSDPERAANFLATILWNVGAFLWELGDALLQRLANGAPQ